MSAGREELSAVRQLLRANSAAIRRVVEAHHARNPRVFGSVAHGNDTTDSDIDFLVEPTADTTLMDIGSIRLELRRLLGCRLMCRRRTRCQKVSEIGFLPRHCRFRLQIGGHS